MNLAFQVGLELFIGQMRVLALCPLFGRLAIEPLGPRRGMVRAVHPAVMSPGTRIW